jgi:hypothetical protein
MQRNKISFQELRDGLARDKGVFVIVAEKMKE